MKSTLTTPKASNSNTYIIIPANIEIKQLNEFILIHTIILKYTNNTTIIITTEDKHGLIILSNIDGL